MMSHDQCPMVVVPKALSDWTSRRHERDRGTSSTTQGSKSQDRTRGGAGEMKDALLFDCLSPQESAKLRRNAEHSSDELQAWRPGQPHAFLGLVLSLSTRERSRRADCNLSP